jgi:hypothetical protein
MDDLFLTPGDAVGRSREPAKHRAGKRFRGINGNRFLVAVSAVVAVAAFFGCSALAGSLKGGAPAPSHGALPQVPQPAIASASGSPSAIVRGSPPATVSGSPPAPQLSQTGAAPAIATGARHAIPHMSPAPTVASPTPTVAASPTATSGQPAVTVSYAIDEQVGDSFEAEIDVTNDGSSSISGWQILVALPHDQVTELANATGYVSNHILLLQPASSGSAIAPGATLRVYLDAQGTQTAPELCAFDNVICG